MASRREQIAATARGPVAIVVQRGRAERFFGGLVALWWGTGSGDARSEAA